MTANIREALDHRTATVAIRRFIESYASEMETSSVHHGCPIATVALEPSTASEVIRKVCAEVFAEWQRLLAGRLKRDGWTKREAEKLAGVILSALEGAMILCRSRRSTKRPLGDQAEQLPGVPPGYPRPVRICLLRR